MKHYFKTGDVAKLHNVTPDTVRFYDKEHIVMPTIVKQKYRYYDLAATLRFSTATLLREMDMSIPEIRNYLSSSKVEDKTALNNHHLSVLEQQKLELEQKIDYLTKFNQRLQPFKSKPNQIEIVQNESIYICEGLEFTMGNHTQIKNEAFDTNETEDRFWNRTSLICRLHQKSKDGSIDNNTFYCGNIIGSSCDDVKHVKFKQALRFNYIGNSKDDLSYLNEISNEVALFCTKHCLQTTNSVYELYITPQLNQEMDEQFYICIYFPLL